MALEWDGTAAHCRARWRKAKGYPMADSARDTLAVTLEDKTLTAVDVSIWDGEGAVDEADVPLEFLVVGAPRELDSDRLGPALKTRVDEVLQEQRRAVFKKELKKREEATLRRRKTGAAP